MRVGSLFAGIGGFDLGLERAGFEIAWQVEIDPYCQRVLAKHWADVRRYADITAIDWANIEPVDLLCGGPPCQPFSLLGKRIGASDTRNLWPETLSAVRALRPRWVIFENVIGVERHLAQSVIPALEHAGYANTPWGEIIPLDIPACAVGAPHRRHRIWIVAYAQGEQARLSGQPWEYDSVDEVFTANTQSLGRQQGNTDSRRNGQRARTTKEWTGFADGAGWPSPPDVCRVDVRIPDWSHRIRSIGNSIVPQIAEWIGRQIMTASTAGKKGKK